ncbi:MAG: hypothetical protein ACOX6U_08220 [Oscillospiraceae bacterium]|jgi:hypothetical protein
MKNEAKHEVDAVNFAEQTPQIQIGESKLSELYKKAFLENDTGVSNEYCLNTTSWD